MRRVSIAFALVTFVLCTSAFAQVEGENLDLSTLLERTALAARNSGLILKPIPNTPCVAGSVICGQTVTGRVSFDSCNSNNVYGVSYIFNGTQGQRVTISGRSPEFAATVALGNSTGTAILAQADVFQTGQTATITNFSLPYTGANIVLITPGTTTTFGDYTITLTCPSTSTSCTENSTTACMLSGRFRVTVRYRNNFDNNVANANALKKTVTGFANPNFETSFFYFNDTNNIEMMVKLLDQGNTNSAGQRTIAVLFGSATPLRIEVNITDTQTGATKTYHSLFNEMKGTTDFIAFVR